MTIETAADRAMLLDADDFGATVTVVDSGATFEGIFDKTFVDTGFIVGNRPVLLARTSDLADNSVSVGGTLSVGGVSYTVRVLEPDGTGMTNLILEEA